MASASLLTIKPSQQIWQFLHWKFPSNKQSGYCCCCFGSALIILKTIKSLAWFRAQSWVLCTGLSSIPTGGREVDDVGRGRGDGGGLFNSALAPELKQNWVVPFAGLLSFQWKEDNSPLLLKGGDSCPLHATANFLHYYKNGCHDSQFLHHSSLTLWAAQDWAVLLIWHEYIV